MKTFPEVARHPRPFGSDNQRKAPAVSSAWRTLGWLWALGILCLQAQNAWAWKNGELLIWMDTERGRAVQELGDRFQRDLGIKVSVETPEKLTTSFPIAAQAGKGPDIVIWAHDKVAEWADGGLLAPVTPM